MTLRSLVIGLVSIALAVLLVPSPSPAGTAEERRASIKVKDLSLTLESTGEPESGSKVVFDGSGPAALAGKTAVLRRQVVSDGEWVAVSKVPIAADGSFSIEGVATGVGANKWQVQALEKTGAGKKATKTRHLSDIISTTVYAWYFLTEEEPVDTRYMSTDSATIGGTGYPRSVYGYSYAGDYGEIAWAEYNVSYRCKAVNAQVGIDDSAETGFKAKFFMLLDGAETSLGQLGLGPAKDVTVDTSSRLRVRFEVRPGDGIPRSDIDGRPVFGDARALCSGAP